MELYNKTFLAELKIDEGGVFASGFSKNRLPWGTIVGVIGYRKKKLLGRFYHIGIAVQDDNNSEIKHFSPLVTSDIWKYLYFLESIARHLIDNHRAIGGKTWCARPLDKEGRIIEDNDLYRAYVLCRILSDRIGVSWFDHTQEEEGAVSLTYLSKRLIKNGTECQQLSDALEKTRFSIQEDGSINMFTSTGYRILNDARLLILSKKSQ
ncbi:MAG: hypothetical protein M0R70_07110 [Nitrospirae bacterium]|nr:hypothetical protein [Nitrospirota bacterium]